MLDVKSTLAKVLNMLSGWQTLNVNDTWVPVYKDGILYHRVLSRNQTNNLELVARSVSVTVSGNSTATKTIDISAYVNGYNKALLYVNNSNINLIATNYWISGNVINAIFWNRSSSSQTGNMQIVFLRWKSDT